MVGGFLVCLIFFLLFRAIGRSNEKRGPIDTFGVMMKEQGWYILGVFLIIALIGLIVALF